MSDDERHHEHGRQALGAGREPERPACTAAHAVERHHDQPAEEDRADVGQEQEQRAAGLVARARLEGEPDDGERRDEGDRDRDARAACRTRPRGRRRRRRPLPSRARRRGRRDADGRARRPASCWRRRPAPPRGGRRASRSRPPGPSRRRPAAASGRGSGRRRVTTESTVPRIGVISGATIIAPITVAVESATTPAVAIRPARTSSVQKRAELAPALGPVEQKLAPHPRQIGFGDRQQRGRDSDAGGGRPGR